jgi:hypothetical protein
MVLEQNVKVFNGEFFPSTNPWRILGSMNNLSQLADTYSNTFPERLVLVSLTKKGPGQPQ